jgi:hypothetical protein
MTDHESGVPVRAGRYRHYKGNEYTVIGVAQHSETREYLVVYRPEYGDRGLWVRPVEMFLESIHIDGREVPRFCFIGPVVESTISPTVVR